MSRLLTALTLRMQASGEQALLTLLGYVAALLLILLSIGAFFYASATAISAAYGPVWAALATAGSSLLLACVLIGWLSYRRRRLQRQARMRQLVQPEMAGLAATLVPSMIKASPIGTLAAFAAAAYVLQRVSEQSRPHRK